MTLAARGNQVTEPLLSLAASLFPDSIRSFQTKARIHVLEGRPEAAISALQQGYGRGADNDAQLDRQIDALRKAPSLRIALNSLTKQGPNYCATEIDRASCRERVGQYVSVSVVQVPFKKK